jgi:hypothetical protein
MRIGLDLARRAIADPLIDQTRRPEELLRFVAAHRANRPKHVVWQDVVLGIAPSPSVPAARKRLEVSLFQCGRHGRRLRVPCPALG